MSRVPCRFGKHGLEEFFGAAQALLGEHDGLGLVDRVVDQALLVEPVERVPIKPLPGPPVVVKGQIEERQHRVIDLVRVERHPRTVPELLELRWGSWPHALMSVVNPLWAQLSGQRRMAWVDELC